MFPKAINLKLNEGTSLEVTFQDGQVKQYDISSLFAKYPQLEALTDRTMFLKGHLMGSYGIVWNDDLDIEVETVYEDGVTVRTDQVSAAMLVGCEITKARSHKAWTQKDLATATGIDQSDISKIERGVANPSISTLERIADKLGCKLSITL